MVCRLWQIPDGEKLKTINDVELLLRRHASDPSQRAEEVVLSVICHWENAAVILSNFSL